MKANNDVTQALQRTMGLMQGELEKSILSNQLLGNVVVLVCQRHLLILDFRTILGFITCRFVPTRHLESCHGHFKTAHCRLGKVRLAGPHAYHIGLDILRPLCVASFETGVA
jgi:hypothetical protein